jgi:hypothetical protein
LLWLWSVGGALPYRHGGRGKSLHRPLVDRGAGEVADAGKTALGAPLLTGALLPTTMGADVKGSVIAMAHQWARLIPKSIFVPIFEQRR